MELYKFWTEIIKYDTMYSDNSTDPKQEEELQKLLQEIYFDRYSTQHEFTGVL